MASGDSSETKVSENRFIEINQGIVGPREPRMRSVKVKMPGDYPAVPRVYLEVAGNYSSPFFVGPPVCDELIELVQHMFTEEEAMIMRHLKPFVLPQSAASIAEKEKRPVEEVERILKRLANEKHIIFSIGKKKDKRYFSIPIFPGAMESIFFRNSKDGITDWHVRFAELFEKLYETGYILAYAKNPAPFVRYLPVQTALQSVSMAWPSDKIEVILERYDSFAVTYCQCRLAEDLLERSCSKPLETCVIMGGFAETLIRSGRMRRAERQEVIEIKKNAEAHGLVTWINNEESGRGTNISCSCCGCCCHMLRMVTEFNVPSMVAPPHFIPHFNDSLCIRCGKCAGTCTMGAITVDTINKTHNHSNVRCIGCGICVTSCSNKAINLKEVSSYKAPPSNRLEYLAKILPNGIKSLFHAIKTHKPGYGGK